MKKNEWLQSIDSRLLEIEKTLVRNTTSLEEHMRRTQIVEEELKPIKTHVTVMNALAKIVIAIITLAVSIKKLFPF